MDEINITKVMFEQNEVYKKNSGVKEITDLTNTNKPTTIISNDADAWIGASYAADTKLYIDNKVQEIASAVIASASEAE